MGFIKKGVAVVEIVIATVAKLGFGKKGFTLIELIVVVIIIGILAAIAGPMMSGNVKKAKVTEAIAALGAIRTAERLYYQENNKYVAVAIGAWNSGDIKPYLTNSDISGLYFDHNAYNVVSSGTTTFTAKATGSNSTATKHADVAGIVANIDDTGVVNSSGY